MWNSDAPGFLGMLKLNMAALGGDLVPAILLQGHNDITALHLQIIHTNVYDGKCSEMCLLILRE